MTNPEIEQLKRRKGLFWLMVSDASVHSYLVVTLGQWWSKTSWQEHMVIEQSASPHDSKEREERGEGEREGEKRERDREKEEEKREWEREGEEGGERERESTHENSNTTVASKKKL
jgi:hypothetical protein